MDTIIQLDIYEQTYKEILAEIYRAPPKSTIDINYGYRQYTSLDRALLYLSQCKYLIRLQDRYTYTKQLDCLSYAHLLALYAYYEHIQKHKIYTKKCKNSSFLSYLDYHNKYKCTIYNNYLDIDNILRYSDIVTARQTILQLTEKELKNDINL